MSANSGPGLVPAKAAAAVDDLRSRDGLAFRAVVDEAMLATTTSRFFPSYRETAFSPPVTLFAWLAQTLSSDKSCREAVSKVNEDRLAAGLAPVAAGTAGYCEARGRLPADYIHQIAYATGLGLEKEAPEEWLWKGRHLKVVDGSTFTMADTPDNQAAFPQISAQDEGAGFPIARFVAVMSLAMGTIIDAAFAPYEGKKTGEHALLRQLLHCFDAGDIALGDAYYGAYFLVAALRAMGIDCVFRVHGARDVDFRRGRRLSKGDHLVAWEKPRKPDWMTAEEYALFPDAMVIRESRFTVDVPGFRSTVINVATTLVEAKRHTKKDLADLYRRRWAAEVNLRTLKTTMKMEHIRCQSPEMVARDFWMHVLAYNLIRKLMAQAAHRYGREPWQISFKGTIQTLGAYRNLWRYSRLDPQVVMDCLHDAIHQHVVGNRPGRYEPRAQKRRPKSYPFLKGKRLDARRSML
jgi:hypothetical protein